MIKYKKVTRTTEEISSVKCDKCGKEYDAGDLEVQEFHHLFFIVQEVILNFSDETWVWTWLT